MPAQVYQSTLAKRLGQKVVAAHQETKDKPVDTGLGFVRLPGGVNMGEAQLNKCHIAVHGMDVKSEHLRGQEYFLASGIAKSPIANAKGEKVAGIPTQYRVELVDEPARGERKAVAFADNWKKFQDFFGLFGIEPAPATATTAEAIMAYYQANLTALAQRKPHFNFSTREWVPPARPGQKQGDPMVFETWHPECIVNGQADPGAGVTVVEMQPEPFTEPPQGNNNGAPTAPATTATTTTAAATEAADPADVIVALVELVMSDVNRLSEQVSAETKEAIDLLADAARQAGAAAGMDAELVEQMIAEAPDYDVVGQMALGVFEAVAEAAAPITPTAGMKVKFCKRDSKGEKLKDAKKNPFPAQEIEVVTVDAANKTVTAKTKDGKPVTDLKKNVIAIKWEWLE